MRKINLEPYKKRIIFLYLDKGLSLEKISQKIGISAGTIRKNMLNWKIQLRPSRKRDLVKLKKEELEELYVKNKLTLNKISKKYGISESTVFRWTQDYKIPLKRFKYKKTEFSGNLQEKAYLKGLRFGDLYVCRNCRQIWVELTTTHPAMIKIFYNTFSKYGTPKKHLKHNRITKRNEWRIHVLLDSSFHFLLSKDFSNVDPNYFYSFLAGFFDSEGCLFVYNNHGYIGLSLLLYNSDKKLLGKIKERLEEDGFHPKLSINSRKGRRTTNNYSSSKDLWYLRLHTNKEVISLINKMPIKHEEKLSKAKIALQFPSKNRWVEISTDVIWLRNSIKEEVKKFVK